MLLKQLLLLSLLGFALAAPNSKVEPRLAKSLRSQNIANIFVKFENGNQDVFRGLSSLRFNSRAEKSAYLVASLKRSSQSTQGNVLSMLQHSPLLAYSAVSFEPFWVSNEIYVKGASPQLISVLESLPEVSEIREERVIQIEEISVHKGTNIQQNDWNLDKVEASNAWGLPEGNNGQGVVVANIDTGVRHTHEAIRENYRSDYGWFDAYSGTPEPIDTQGHGTHTIATIAGKAVGVAPGAQWIACQGCFWIFCTESALKACGQWVLCPTKPDGTEADCSKAPQVVSNSWGGGGAVDFYDDVIAAWKAADIIPVFAIGNEGPMCGTTQAPGERDVIAVGSTNKDDLISGFSSVGPTADGVIKPDISAPGENVYSATADSDSSYAMMNGTSMACPHVAGAVTLLLSRKPDLSYDQVKDILEQNTDTNLVDTGVVCGGIPSTTFPNNQYGHGRLNARKALDHVINNF